MITGAWAVLLLGIAFVLTWRAQLYQRQFNHLLDVESRAIVQLKEVARAHNGFAAQWMMIESPKKQGELREHYRAVRQLLLVAPLSELELPNIQRAMSEFEEAMRAPESAEETRLRSRVVSAMIEGEIRDLEKTVDNQMRAMATDARNTMWVALGTAYIIAILSFAVARLALLKVVRPLEELSHAAERIAAEDFSARAHVRGDLEIAQLAGSFNRMAEQLAASHHALRERARTDELTGLPNFRAFREVLAGEIERAKRYRHSFALLVFDVDHFKQYNDEFGHLAGNEALKIVAETIRTTLRTVDIAARYGGEEFVAVLPEIGAETLGATAERIRARVASMAPIQGSRRLTVSIGGSVFPTDGETAEELFEAADTRLYEAKGAGRNRVVVPEPVRSE